MLKVNFWLCLLLVLAMFGCSNTKIKNTQKNLIALNEELFELDKPIISESELYELTEQQQQYFLKFYKQQSDRGYLPHEVIRRFFESNLSNFTYYGKTYTASEAMLNNSGNCMSLAILTTAFSRLIGVEMDYRKMHSLPIYEKHGNVVLSSSHVQSLLYDPSFVPEENYLYVNRPAIVIDYFPQDGNIRSKIINSSQFLSMYYVNKSAEYYIEKQLDSAFLYASQAYYLDNENVSALNLLALVYKNKGDEKLAEKLYLSAMASKNRNISILDNYVNLLKQQGRSTRARHISKRIENMYDPNPYHWLEKAQFAMRDNRLDAAERFYRKVIKLAPYVKQAYVGLHEVYLLQGKKSLAISTLQKSLPWLHEPKQKRQFKKKLYQLSAAI